MELQTYFSGALLKIGRARNRGDEYVYKHNLDAPAEAGRWADPERLVCRGDRPS